VRSAGALRVGKAKGGGVVEGGKIAIRDIRTKKLLRKGSLGEKRRAFRPAAGGGAGRGMATGRGG